MLTGTSGADNYSASNTTLNAGDSVTGGDGADKLAIFTSGTAATSFGGFTTSGVETISISTSGGASTVNLGNVSGETGLQVTGASQDVTFTNTNNIVPVELSYNSAGNVTVTYNASTVVGTADSGSFDLIDTTNATLTMAGVETLNMSSSGTSTITTVTAAAATTHNITGDGTLTTDIGDAAVTVDMSGFSGTSTTSGYGTGAITITGGSGADTVSMANTLTGTNGDVIDLGDGADTLKLTAATNAFVTSTTAGDVTVSNVENLHLTIAAASDAIDFDVFSAPAFDKVQVLSQLAAANITLTDTQSSVFELTNTNNATANDVNAMTIDLKDSTGTADAVTLTLKNVDIDGSMTLATLTAAGVETLNLTADAKVVAGTPGDMAITNLTATALKTVTIDGDADLTLPAFSTTVTSMDASTMTGDLAVTFSGAITTATGGAGADTFTYGTSFTDDDTVDGGAGKDILAITGAGATMNVGATNIETLNVTTGGADTYDLNDMTTLTTINAIYGGAGHDATLNNVSATVTTVIVDGAASATATLTVDLDSDTAADSATIRLDYDSTGFEGDITANDFETLVVDLNFTGAGAVSAKDIDDFDAVTATDATHVTVKTTNISSWDNDFAQFGNMDFSANVTIDLTGMDIAVGLDGALAITAGFTQGAVENAASAKSFGTALTGEEGFKLTAADAVTVILDDDRTVAGRDEMYIDLDRAEAVQSETGGVLGDTNIDTIKFNDDGSSSNDIGMVIVTNFQSHTNYSATTADKIDLSGLGVTGLSDLVLLEAEDKQGMDAVTIFARDGSDADSVGDKFAGFIYLIGVEAVDVTASDFVFA
jgi:hypothetical protein